MLREKLSKKIVRFIKHKTKVIQKEWIIILSRKIWVFFKLPLILFVSFLLLPMILLTRILRPFVLIRFGLLNSTRIGHYAEGTELYLCERDAGLQPRRAFDIFLNDRIICNHQLKKMWGRILHILPSRLTRPLLTANKFLPGYGKHIISLPKDRDIHNLYERIPAHLTFTIEEEKKGYDGLRKMGISEESRFVCFIGRDSNYLNCMFPGVNWDYHRVRDTNINNFIPAMEELVKRGYYTIRMGAVPKKHLKTDNPCIIDYAKKFRTDFMDIFLCAKCIFHIGVCTGLYAVPSLFRRPVVTVNFLPFEYVFTWRPHELFIPKKLWLKKDSRFMTFREILESGIGRSLRAEQYEQAGIEAVENTSEEIRDVTIEMDERLKGSWQTTEEDEELQQRFWALFKSSKFHGVIRSRIGRDFLRQNRDLLE